MSYMGLVDIGLNVDTSGLQETLERLDNNVEILVGKVKELEEVSWDEDTIHDQIASYIATENIMDSDDVDRAIDDKLDGYVSTDDLDQNIQDKLDENNYVTENDVREMAHSEGVLQEDSAEFTELVQRVEALEGEDNESVDRLKQRVTSLEQRADDEKSVEAMADSLDSLETRHLDLVEQVKAQDSAIDSQLARLEDLEKRADDEKSIESLAERMAQQDARIDTLLAHIEQLTLKMGETLERSDTALTFFGLIKQAFALLQRGS